tara:strand:+ start:26178 stop:26447 length:270 start_codon:yes stop_codon:yes gene_type:complete
MKNQNLPARTFQSPLVEFVNFNDGTNLNLIRLFKPYANGISFVIQNSTEFNFSSNSIFKTYELAKNQFDSMAKVLKKIKPMRNEGITGN